MPESGFRLTRVDTIMLGVREVERSVKFYRDVLGMSLVSQFPGFAFIVGGGVTLGLSELPKAACTCTCS